MTTAIVWLRNDLRLRDQPALHAACARFDRVLPVYIHSAAQSAQWAPGAASCWWLHHSLAALDTTLRQQGGKLHLARGESLDVLRRLIHHTRADTVYWNRRYDPAGIAQDTAIKKALRADGIEVESHPGNLWCEPWRMATAQGTPYRVFTPYWRKLRPQLATTEPLPLAIANQWAQGKDSLTVDSLGLLPDIHWDQGLAATWQPGETGAREMLDIFLDDAGTHYAAARDLPAQHGTSRMSPYLHFGEITPRQLYHALDQRNRDRRENRRPDVEPYLRELGWREFAHHLLYHFPTTPKENFKRDFDDFCWAGDNPQAIERWQRGCTGIPLVDAGMRELWHTGWMHNRVRMIAASWLTKNLRQHWHHGARWFWDTLVDADLANNTLGWQWVAGTGADAAPYFRVFNPYRQAARFDPDAVYLRRWLPELAALPTRLLLEPWRDRKAVSATGYPPAMADAKDTRKQALAAWQDLKGTNG